MCLAARALEADDQHVLGEPALLARLPARDAQCVAFLSEQRVAAVAGAEALDRVLLGKVHDEAPLGIELADGVQPAHEDAVVRDALERGAAGASHDQHVEHDIGAVGDLDAAARQRRVERPHAVGDDVKRALAHAAAEQLAHLGVRLLRIHPVIVRAGILLRARADVGEMLDPRDIVRRRAVQVTAGEAFCVERLELAALQELRGQLPGLGIAPLAPVNRARLRQLAHRVHPIGHGAAQLGQRSQLSCGSSHSVAPLLLEPIS